MLYPIRLNPIIKQHIWGGRKLLEIKKNQIRKMDSSLTYGESWDVSGVDGSVSTVANGFLKGNTLNEILEVYMADLVGEKIYEKYGNEFPMLVKTLDCADRVSVQVHPDDAIAMERHNTCGKTEMWYIQDAEPGSIIYLGFKDENITREQYIDAVAMGTVEDILYPQPVNSGDVFFIPAGTVHALSKGLVVIEIQEPVDLTYRIFDWNRVDRNGKARELHTALAVDAIDFHSTAARCRRTYSLEPDKVSPLVSCPCFTTNIISVANCVVRDYCSLDSFVIYECTMGTVEVDVDGQKELLNSGDMLLIPASLSDATLSGKGIIVESYIEI